MTSRRKDEKNPEAQVHVWRLPHTITEVDLFYVFEKCGKINFIHLIPKPKSRERQSHAYVHFDTRLQANAALRLSGIEVLGRPVLVTRIDWIPEPEANLFVKNFPLDYTSVKLEELFTRFGEIQSCMVCYNGSNESRGYGLVQFVYRRDAEEAISALSGLDIEGSQIDISKFKAQDLEGELYSKRNLYVRGFGPDYTQQNLRDRFTAFGEITSVVVFHKGEGVKARDFGMVCLATEEAARAAIEALHSKEVDGINWIIEHYMRRRDYQWRLRKEYKTMTDDWKKRNLVVKNLDPSDETKLQTVFTDFGAIESTRILKNEPCPEAEEEPARASSDLAFVCFEQEEDANRAHRLMDRKDVEGKRIKVSKWLPKQELHRKIQYSMLKKLSATQTDYMAAPTFISPLSTPFASSSSSTVPFSAPPQEVTRPAPAETVSKQCPPVEEEFKIVTRHGRRRVN
jgi:polyadenylate-binding protein